MCGSSWEMRPSYIRGGQASDRQAVSILSSSHCKCPYLKSPVSSHLVPWQPLPHAVWLKVILFFLEPLLRVCRRLVLISWSHLVDEANINAWRSPIPGTHFCQSSTEPIHKAMMKVLTDGLEGGIWRSCLSERKHIHHIHWDPSGTCSEVTTSAVWATKDGKCIFTTKGSWMGIVLRRETSYQYMP